MPEKSDPSTSAEGATTSAEGATSAGLLLDAVGEAFSDSDQREALAKLAGRARRLVEELARSATRRAGPRAEPPVSSSTVTEERQSVPDRSSAAEEAGLARRLRELGSRLGEVADVLDATVERLETIESQLGSPDVAVEHKLADGIHRCERLLLGIDHRVRMREPLLEQKPAPAAQTVLVVASDSEVRARLCLALERQGLAVRAATCGAAARRVAASTAAACALVIPDTDVGHRLLQLEDWIEGVAQGELPRAALFIERGAAPPDEALSMTLIHEDHGEAAMAAVLVRLCPVDAGSGAFH
ncbi:MAG TPA: hypothetical protein VGK20_16010 [Candidatus Binatia bacterium]|jgi:hypothetical protein